MGLGLLKDIKFLKVCLENLTKHLTKRPAISSEHLIPVALLLCAVVSGKVLCAK